MVDKDIRALVQMLVLLQMPSLERNKVEIRNQGSVKVLEAAIQVADQEATVKISQEIKAFRVQEVGVNIHVD